MTQDFKGYLKFISPRIDAAEIRQNLGIDADFNPYGVEKENPAAILRLTEEMAQKHIFDNTDEVEAGYYLSKLQELCMVRRTYASTINSESIGPGLPGLVRRHISLEFDPESAFIRNYSRK